MTATTTAKIIGFVPFQTYLDEYAIPAREVYDAIKSKDVDRMVDVLDEVEDLFEFTETQYKQISLKLTSGQTNVSERKDLEVQMGKYREVVNNFKTRYKDLEAAIYKTTSANWSDAAVKMSADELQEAMHNAKNKYERKYLKRMFIAKKRADMI